MVKVFRAIRKYKLKDFAIKESTGLRWKERAVGRQEILFLGRIPRGRQDALAVVWGGRMLQGRAGTAAAKPV